MTREQCKHCGRNSYRDGRCYADRVIKGRPIGETVYCGWAKPCESLSKRHKKAGNDGNKPNH